MTTIENYIYYNSWDETYRSPVGAVRKDLEIKFRVQAVHPNVENIYLIIRKDEGHYEEIQLEPEDDDYYQNILPMDDSRYFQTSFKAPHGSGLYFYAFRFEIKFNGGLYSGYFANNQNEFGGPGEVYYSLEDAREYQLTVYERDDYAPEWYLNGVAYHIFVDRFYNGNENNQVSNPKPDSVIYTPGTEVPIYIRNEAGEVIRWDFFGGNLKGIIKKLPYLHYLGISILYLSPIFEARSNHKYDAGDYHKIDPMFGDEELFQELIEEAKKYNMYVILDGVFNHTGADSIYFNKEGNYESLGAYQSPDSPYFNWYTFHEFPEEYESWWGVKDLPRLNTESDEVRNFFLRDENSVVKYWDRRGVSGWRLDVVDELSDGFLWELRQSIEESSNGYRHVLIGEVWEDASNKVSYGQRRHYINGTILNGVMNYPFRTLILQYLKEEIDADYMAKSFMHLQENYPNFAFTSGMNNVGSHDTKRIKTVLDENTARVRLAFALMFMIPGTPTIYYGDEAGLIGHEDPDNRRPFPWGKEDKSMQNFVRKWTHFRRGNNTLYSGTFLPFAVGNVFGILRLLDTNYWIAFFINPSSHTAFVDLESIDEKTYKPVKDFLRDHNIRISSLDPYSYKLFYSNDSDPLVNE